HVTFWESVVVWRLRPDVQQPWPDDLPFGDVSAVNDRLRDFARGFSVAEVKERAAHCHALVGSVLAEIEESKLDEVPAGDRDERPNWEIIAADTCTHYPEHTAMIERVFPG